MKKNDTHYFFYTNHYSNFHNCRFTYKGHEFTNSEQAFMWCKAVFFKDQEAANGLLQMANDPMSAKMLGRLVRNYNDEEWSKVRYQFMYEVCLEKFRQNEYLKKDILETGDLCFVEASPTDRIWGIGLDEKDPAIYIESKWRGQNLLGKVLNDVRKTLKEEVS